MAKNTEKSAEYNPPGEKLERAFDAFLSGNGEDDMARLFNEVQTTEAAPPVADAQQPARVDPRDLPPTRKRKSKKQMALTPDPKWLPKTERALQKEPMAGILANGLSPTFPEPDPDMVKTVIIKRPVFSPSPEDFFESVDESPAIQAAGPNAEQVEETPDIQAATGEDLDSVLAAFSSAIDALEEADSLLELDEDALIPEAEAATFGPVGPVTLEAFSSYAAPQPPPTRDVSPSIDPIPLHDDPDQALTDYSPPAEATPPTQKSVPVEALNTQPLDAFIGEARSSADQRFALENEFSLGGRIETLLRLCEQVAHAHSAGRLHRGLRPGNILIGDFNNIHLQGWLSAQEATDPKSGSSVVDLSDPDVGFFHVDDQVDLGPVTLKLQSGKYVVANPRYLSPEVARGGMVFYNNSSEIYALGLLVFETLGLHPALPGGTISDVMKAAENGQLYPFHKAASSRALLPSFTAVVEKATAFAPEDRYFSVSDLIEDLKALRMGHKPVAFRPTPLKRFIACAPKLAASALASAAVVGIGGALTFGIGAPMAPKEASVNHMQVAIGAQVRSEVNHRALGISNQLEQFEGEVFALAAATVPVLEHAEPMDGPIYRLFEFRTPGRQPSDLKTAEGYPAKVSLDWPMYKLYPDGDISTSNNLARQIQWLRPQIQQAFTENGRSHTTPVAQLDLSNHVVQRVFISLDAGLTMLYPGHAGLPDAYDARTVENTQFARSSTSPQWGAPYIESLSSEFVIPLAMAIQGDDSETVGIIGLEMDTKRLASDLLDPAKLPAGSLAYIVNGQGEIILGQESAHAPDTVTTANLSDPEFIQAMARNGAGQLSLKDGGVATYAGLGVADWTLVVTLDETSFQHHSPNDGSVAVASHWEG